MGDSKFGIVGESLELGFVLKTVLVDSDTTGRWPITTHNGVVATSWVCSNGQVKLNTNNPNFNLTGEEVTITCYIDPLEVHTISWGTGSAQTTYLDIERCTRLVYLYIYTLTLLTYFKFPIENNHCEYWYVYNNNAPELKDMVFDFRLYPALTYLYIRNWQQDFICELGSHKHDYINFSGSGGIIEGHVALNDATSEYWAFYNRIPTKVTGQFGVHNFIVDTLMLSGADYTAFDMRVLFPMGIESFGGQLGGNSQAITWWDSDDVLPAIYKGNNLAENWREPLNNVYDFRAFKETTINCIHRIDYSSQEGTLWYLPMNKIGGGTFFLYCYQSTSFIIHGENTEFYRVLENGSSVIYWPSVNVTPLVELTHNLIGDARPIQDYSFFTGGTAKLYLQKGRKVDELVTPKGSQDIQIFIAHNFRDTGSKVYDVIDFLPELEIDMSLSIPDVLNISGSYINLSEDNLSRLSVNTILKQLDDSKGVTVISPIINMLLGNSLPDRYTGGIDGIAHGESLISKGFDILNWETCDNDNVPMDLIGVYPLEDIITNQIQDNVYSFHTLTPSTSQYYNNTPISSMQSFRLSWRWVQFINGVPAWFIMPLSESNGNYANSYFSMYQSGNSATYHSLDGSNWISDGLNYTYWMANWALEWDALNRVFSIYHHGALFKIIPTSIVAGKYFRLWGSLSSIGNATTTKTIHKDIRLKHIGVELEYYLTDAYLNFERVYGLVKRDASAVYCLTVRRDSDDAETQVILQDKNPLNLFSLVSAGGNLENWAGTDNVFVKIIHEQIGNGDFIQTVHASQPQLLNAGELILVDGKASIYFDGIDDFMAATPLISTSGSLLYLAENGAAQSNSFELSQSGSNLSYVHANGINSFGNSSLMNVRKNSVENYYYGDTITVNSVVLAYIRANLTDTKMRVNQVDQNMTVEFGTDQGEWFGYYPAANLEIGRINRNTPIYTEFHFQELLMSTEDEDLDIEGMEIDVLKSYNLTEEYIYLLDTIEPVDTAWSFEKIQAGATLCCRLRESGTANEVDLFLEEQGSITLDSLVTGAITLGDWIGAGTAEILTMYDQSGYSNDWDYFITTPNLVTNGVLETINGVACAFFHNDSCDFAPNTSIFNSKTRVDVSIVKYIPSAKANSITFRSDGGTQSFTHASTVGSGNTTIIYLSGVPSLFVDGVLELPLNRSDVHDILHDDVLHTEQYENINCSSYQQFVLGSYGGSIFGLAGSRITELIGKASDLSSNRVDIQLDQKSRYGTP